ncbi:hypothetical protein [Streptomyces sp. HB132]|uniref:hypothetical protein n=1 Tax=Streptomyces sp. HB132 TaxID=767388 RepID=UPI00195F5923|nr:hypothetical protein [Streptomyces sp. HB132]MBM7442989.1 hypothetical protein [Streptomyces sp. HB132]
MTGNAHGPTVRALPPQVRPLARLSAPDPHRSGLPALFVSRGGWPCTRAGVRLELGRADDRGPEDHEARRVAGSE